MRVILEVVRGAQKGKRFEFDRHSTFMVGRAEDRRVQFRIPNDRHFSRFHFMVEVNPPECFLRDLGSTNGTYVNEEKVRQANLRDGDVVHGGRTWMRVQIDRAETPPLVREPPADAELPRVAVPRTEGGKPSMKTTVFGQFEGPREEAGPLRCAVCDRLAEDTLLGDLGDTQMISYVCRACREKESDDRHPIPNYEVLGKLGSGALGPVYKARRVSTGTRVALKIIPPHLAGNPKAVKLFLREMQVGSRLDHPHIVPVIELGEAGGDLWIASELVDGPDAGKLAEQLGGTVPLRDTVQIVVHVLGALDYAHQTHKLVHRDVKPPNILVTGGPGAYTARLGDFGLMKNMDEAGLSGITRKGEVRGTVPFMPPEQVIDCRKVKAEGDIYMAGATLYWLVTGQYVHDFGKKDARGETKDPFLIILDQKVVPIRKRSLSVPESVARVIHQALEREPEDRFETAAEMALALERAMA